MIAVSIEHANVCAAGDGEIDFAVTIEIGKGPGQEVGVRDTHVLLGARREGAVSAAEDLSAGGNRALRSICIHVCLGSRRPRWIRDGDWRLHLAPRIAAWHLSDIALNVATQPEPQDEMSDSIEPVLGERLLPRTLLVFRRQTDSLQDHMRGRGVGGNIAGAHHQLKRLQIAMRCSGALQNWHH